MTSQDLTSKIILDGLSLPTLEETSIIAFAIEFLQEDEVKKVFLKHFSAEKVNDCFSFNSIVCKFTSLCKSLQIPDIFETKLLSAMHWILEDYFYWIKFVLENLPQLEKAFSEKIDFITHIMNSVRWSKGVINKKDSMHHVLLLKNRKDDVIFKEMFRIASRFCLNDDLIILWEKMSKAVRSKVFWNKHGKTCFFTLYWTCKMKGDMKGFMNHIPNYLKQQYFYDAVKEYKYYYDYALVLYAFEGDISGMKYFKKIATFDNEDKVNIIKTILHGDYCLDTHKLVEKLFFWLIEIKDESILNTIMHEFAKEFLKISIEYWRWQKFLSIFLRMCGDNIDQVFLYDLILQLIENVKIKKADIFQVNTLWKNLPSELKRSFFLFISNKQKVRPVEDFWKIVTTDVFDLFLKDEELRNVLMPYDNYGILECIYAGRFDFIKFWLQKCLISEEAIISYLENFIQTKSVAVIKTLQKIEFSLLIQFLDWAFEHEDFMNRNKIFKVKDEAINETILEMFASGLKGEKWDDLKKLVDWIMKNRKHKYENNLVLWKQKAIQKYFIKPNLDILSRNDFKSSLLDFLTYRVSNPEQIMKKLDLNEAQISFEYLIKGDFAWIDNYLKILKGYGKDIYTVKENIFYHIFQNSKTAYFRLEKFYENIKKLLLWGCENNQEVATNVDEIRKEIIKKYAVGNVVKCVNFKWRTGMCNILRFLFEGKMDDKEWLGMLFDLKMKAIKYEETCNYFWKKKDIYEMIAELINWGKVNENIRTWDIKKYFIKCLKNNVKAETILELILKCKFVCTFFKGDEAMPDFDKTLWDLKEFLVDKVLSENNCAMTCQLFQNFKCFTDFLKWKGYEKTRFENLKIKVINKKGVSCCLAWIKANKLNHVSDFFSWCINDNPFSDLKHYILNLKRNVAKILISTNFNNWKDDYFQRLDEFLLLHSSEDEKDLKRTVIEKHATKSCYKCITNERLDRLKAFIKWAEIEGEESIYNFKRNVLMEFLDVKNIYYWKALGVNCASDLHKFLYYYENPDVKISCLKLDLLEVHIFIIFEKLLKEKNLNSCLSFLKSSFDVNMKADECLPRTQKLIKEMFDKYGKEICILMLRVKDVGALIEFLEFCFIFKTDTEIFNSLLSTYKKNCINQFLSNEIEKTEGDLNPSIEKAENFLYCLNRFVNLVFIN